MLTSYSQVDIPRLVILNSGEGGAEEWKALFHADDNRLLFRALNAHQMMQLVALH